MIVTQVAYKTNANLGNMEHASVELIAMVDHTETVDEVFYNLRDKACELLGLNQEVKPTIENAKTKTSYRKRNS